jgi:hypothetical protein
MAVKSSNKFIASAGALIIALALTSCGNSTKETAVGTFTPEPTAAPKVAGAFGSPLALADGTTYTITAPSTFVPGHFASGQIPGQLFEGFTLQVTNGGKSDLDLGTLVVEGTTPSGACADIFDGDNHVNGAPQTPLPVGKMFNIGWALSCPGKAGDTIDIVVSVGNASLIKGSGKLV